MHLSPADDILIRIERALDIDSEGQMVASILSKKAAAGSTHVVIDMPVGPTAKVRDMPKALTLKNYLEKTGASIGLTVKVLITDGTQPVGRGIGPALEAQDVLAVLRGEASAPSDLREKSLRLAAQIFEMAEGQDAKSAYDRALAILSGGGAWRKFQAICEAQGGLRLPQNAPFTQDVFALRSGRVQAIDNRKLAMVAKLAGAPDASSSGIFIHAELNQKISQGDPVFTIHAETHGELNYALEYVKAQTDIITINGESP